MPVIDPVYERTHEFEGIAEARVLPATTSWTGHQYRHVDERTDPEVGTREPRKDRQLEASRQVGIRGIRRDAIALRAEEDILPRASYTQFAIMKLIPHNTTPRRQNNWRAVPDLLAYAC